MLSPKSIAGAVLLCSATGLAAPPRPNILFCISDDQSYPHAGAYGCTWVRTPAFDRVAREGLLFDHAYTVNAKCSPSRACILTGRNIWQLESAADHAGYYPAGYRTFIEALGAHGYFTGHTAKGWGPGMPGEVDGRPRMLAGPDYSRLTAKPPTRCISEIDYAANFAEFLRARPAGKPFCFWYGSHEPHRKYEYGSGVRLGGKSVADIDRVPRFWPDNETVRNDMLDYAFEIEHFDRHLGRMIALLEKAGELENTIIVVTSDNGMPFPRSKGSCYELSHHMPLAIRWGRGIAHGGRRVPAYVSFIDLAATFLDAAGLTAADAGMEPVQGRSLLPVFRDEPGGIAASDHVLVGQERNNVGRPDDVGYPSRGLFQGDFIFVRNFEPSRWPQCDPQTGYMNIDGGPTKTLILEQNRRGVNHWQWELCFGRHPAAELYDLRSDPDCMVNLASDPAHRGRCASMQKLLFAELEAQHDPRMAGNGAVFDRYPYGIPSMRDFYNRCVFRHEDIRRAAGAISQSDFEAPGFDPERPLAPAAPPPPAPARE